jgi:hypothetical protein
MKTALNFMMAFFLLGFVSACANKEEIYDNICHGMYDGLEQMQENRNPESVPPPWKEPVSYEQYKKELEQSPGNPED